MSNALYHRNTQGVSFLANEVLCNFKIIDNLLSYRNGFAFKFSLSILNCLLNYSYFSLPMYVSYF